MTGREEFRGWGSLSEDRWEGGIDDVNSRLVCSCEYIMEDFFESLGCVGA
jgi:hypothetical protein